MLQRIQSLYLFLTVLISISLFFIPAYQVLPSEATMITSNTLFLVLSIAVGVFSLITIFLFSNRRLQLRICRLCLLLVILTVGLFFITIDKNVSFAAGAYLPLIQIVLLLLAQRSIKKDEELVRSADRLR